MDIVFWVIDTWEAKIQIKHSNFPRDGICLNKE